MSMFNRVFSCRQNWLLSAVLMLCGIQSILFQEAFAQGQPRPPETIYKTDWNERLAPNLGLTAHDHDLLGGFDRSKYRPPEFRAGGCIDSGQFGVARRDPPAP